MAPSPAPGASRFTDPARTAPAAKTSGVEVSRNSGARKRGPAYDLLLGPEIRRHVSAR